MTDPAPVTALLRAWSGGDEGALGQLMPLVEAELRRLARAYMARERIGHTLQASALVNEAFLRLVDARQVQWQDRAHFLGISARLMRRVLVDHARSRGMQKRGGGYKVQLDENMAVAPAADFNLLSLDRALESLAATDERKSRVIEMRFFGGLRWKKRRRRCASRQTRSNGTGDWRSFGCCARWNKGSSEHRGQPLRGPAGRCLPVC